MRARIAILAALALAILIPPSALSRTWAQQPKPAPRATPRGKAPVVPRTEATPAASAGMSRGTSSIGPSEADRTRLAMIRARRQTVEKEIQRLQTQAESTLRDLDSIDLDLQLAAHKLDEAELEFRQTSRQLDATIKAVQTTRKNIEETRPRVVKSLAALSKLGELSYARLLFSIDDPADVLRGYRYVSRIASADATRIRLFRASLTELSGLEDQLKKRTAENVEKRRRLNEARAELSNRKANREARLAQIAQERELQERLADEYRQREEELQQLLGQPDEMGSGGEMARPVAPYLPQVLLRSRKGDLAWPVQGSLMRKFGVERDPKFGTRIIQQGIEIDAFPETEVRAVHPGRVVFADQFVGYGMLVIVDHGHREHTLYGRLGELKVRPGEDVVEGTVLGILPDARLTGSGLHFEVRELGKPEDPLDWLKKR